MSDPAPAPAVSLELTPEQLAHKIAFEQRLREHYVTNPAPKKKEWTRDFIGKVLAMMKNENHISRPQHYHYYVKQYEIFSEDGKEHLILKKRSKENKKVYVVASEDYYVELLKVHTSSHNGRDRMLKDLETCNISRSAVETFIKTCEGCQGRQNPKRRRATIIFAEKKKICVIKDAFDALLLHFRQDGSHSAEKVWSKEELNYLIEWLKDGYSKTVESDLFFRELSIVQQKEDIKIVWTRQGEPDRVVLPCEDYYDNFIRIHNEINHGDFEAFKEAVGANLHIPERTLKMFIDLTTCQPEVLKKELSPTPEDQAPIIELDYNSLGEVLIINMDIDCQFKWLLVYRDAGTDFMHLHPLNSKRPSQIALDLLKIFLQSGPPKILQTETGYMFTKSIISELVKYYPEFQITPCQTPYFLHAIRYNKKFKVRIQYEFQEWVKKNPLKSWTLGCYFVQWMINTSKRSPSLSSPYRAVLNIDPVIDTSSNDFFESLGPSNCFNSSTTPLEKPEAVPDDIEMSEDPLSLEKSLANIEKSLGSGLESDLPADLAEDLQDDDSRKDVKLFNISQ